MRVARFFEDEAYERGWIIAAPVDTRGTVTQRKRVKIKLQNPAAILEIDCATSKIVARFYNQCPILGCDFELFFDG